MAKQLSMEHRSDMPSSNITPTIVDMGTNVQSSPALHTVSMAPQTQSAAEKHGYDGIPVYLQRSKGKPFKMLNTMAILSANIDKVTDRMLDVLQSNGSIAELPNPKPSVVIAPSEVKSDSHKMLRLAFQSIDAPDEAVGKAFDTAIRDVLRDALETSRKNAATKGGKYIGHSEQDIDGIVVGVDKMCPISKSTFDEIAETHDILSYQHGETSKSLLIANDGCDTSFYDENRKKLHARGAFGVEISMDEKNEKNAETMSSYRDRIFERIDELKAFIDEELGLSDEKSKETTLDVSVKQTNELFSSPRLTVAMSGYRRVADTETLMETMKKGLDEIGCDCNIKGLDMTGRRVSPEELNDPYWFEHPKMYTAVSNSNPAPTPDNQPASLNSSLLSEPAASLSNDGPQF